MAQLMKSRQLMHEKAHKLKIAVLASTKASDMQAVINAIENGFLHAEIVAVISNKPDAYCLERAKKHKIPAYFVDPKSFPNRDEYDRAVLKILQQNETELVLMIGYMKIVGKEICEAYRWKLMNIHPSLLPAFAGGMDLNVHEEVIKSGAKITGCTLHFVTEEVDSGPIILQMPVDVADNDTADSLKEKVQIAEQDVILKGIKLFMEGKLVVEGNRVKIAPETM